MKQLLFIMLVFSATVSAQDVSRGERLFKSGNLPLAKVAFEQALLKNPNDLKALEYLGDIHGRNLNWESALTYYKKARDIKPSVAEYHYKYGGVKGMIAKESNKFKALGMIGEIKASFEKAIALDPKHINARWALIELYLQLPGIVGGSEKKAVEYANQLAKISPVDGLLAKARIDEYFERYLSAEKNYIAAIKKGGSETTYKKLADLYKNKLNQPDKAKAIMAEFHSKQKTS